MLDVTEYVILPVLPRSTIEPAEATPQECWIELGIRTLTGCKKVIWDVAKKLHAVASLDMLSKLVLTVICTLFFRFLGTWEEVSRIQMRH